MRWLWTMSGKLAGQGSPERRHSCFRLLNSLLAGGAGLLVWLIVRIFALDSLDWLVCFVGYPVMFHGVFGSTIYLMNKVSREAD